MNKEQIIIEDNGRTIDLSPISSIHGAIYEDNNRIINNRLKNNQKVFNFNQGLINDQSKYWNMSSIFGYSKLRQFVASWRAKSFGNKISEENIMITNGANNAFVLAILELSNINSKITLPKPYFPNHRDACLILNRYPIHCDYGEIKNTSFTLDTDKIIKFMTENNSSLLSFSNPNNPSGSYFAPECIQNLCHIASKNRIKLIFDESYIGSVNKEFHPIYNIKNSIIIGSFSKTFNLGALRLGYIIAESDLINQLSHIQDCLVICPSGVSQEIALSRLTDEVNTNKIIERHSIAINKLLNSSKNIELFTGIAAPFKWIKFKGLFNDILFCRILAEEFGVITTPGTYYGSPGWIRIAFGMISSLDEIELGIKIILEKFSYINDRCSKRL